MLLEVKNVAVGAEDKIGECGVQALPVRTLDAQDGAVAHVLPQGDQELYPKSNLCEGAVVSLIKKISRIALLLARLKFRI